MVVLTLKKKKKTRLCHAVSGQVDVGFHEFKAGTVTILTSLGFGDFGCGCDSAVGGILPQIRGESLVFGETEGELKRERDLGCSSENGVSIFGYIFCAGATKCSTIEGLLLCVLDAA